MRDETYNGWKNYETWAVNLWLTNDQELAEYLDEMAQEALEMAEGNMPPWGDDRRAQARYFLAERLREELSDARPDLGATVWADLLGAAFSAVDWIEIAGNAISGGDTLYVAF